jgi:ribose transport system ATP-binding protein
MTERGACVICASSDHEQLAAICDRVLVFNRGRVVATLEGAAISKAAIAENCYRTEAEVTGRAA